MPSWQPASLNLVASLRPVPDRPATADGLEMVLEVKATNDSSRRAYPPANIWYVSGIKRELRPGSPLHSDRLFRQESNQALREVGLQGYRLEQLLDVWRLRYGHRNEIRDPFLAGFEGYEALTAYAESQDQRDLKAWLGLLERHERCLEVPSEIERVQALALDQPAAGVTSLCTAHKSKGS